MHRFDNITTRCQEKIVPKLASFAGLIFPMPNFESLLGINFCEKEAKFSNKYCKNSYHKILLSIN